LAASGFRISAPAVGALILSTLCAAAALGESPTHALAASNPDSVFVGSADQPATLPLPIQGTAATRLPPTRPVETPHLVSFAESLPSSDVSISRAADATDWPVKRTSHEVPGENGSGQPSVTQLATYSETHCNSLEACCGADSVAQTRSRWLLWEAGVEFVTVKPRFEEGAEELSHAILFDYKLATDPRIWVTATDPSGFSLGARYWGYNEASTDSSLNPAWLPHRRGWMLLDVYTIDLEVAQELVWDEWRCSLGAGARNAWFKHEIWTEDETASQGKTFHGAGPLLSFEARRTLWGSGLELLANARGTLLVGHAKWSNHAAQRWTDDIGATAELQIGGQYRRCCGNLGEVFVRGVWEQQMWLGAGAFLRESDPLSGNPLDHRISDHDVAFMGFAFAIGMRR
jgi:hypothetical protein